MGTWYNNDGLLIKTGITEAIARTAGSPETCGTDTYTEATITLTALSTSTPTILCDSVFIPKNSRIEKIEVIAETAATSAGAATLDIGLIREDRTTELDYNGFVAAMAKTAIDAAGEYNTLTPGSTAVGALVGTTLSNPGLLVAQAGTAVFTAGVVRVRVWYYAV